jgi:serine/threonine protein kinase
MHQVFLDLINLNITLFAEDDTNTGIKKIDEEISQNQSKIDSIIEELTLELADYEMDEYEILRKNGRVSRWVNVNNKGVFAFKIISNKEYQGIMQNQVEILKELNDCNNIIKFYGFISDGSKRYLVTEWAEYGNSREFYTNHKDRFDLRLKLRISLDIARGLNFLRNVEVNDNFY